MSLTKEKFELFIGESKRIPIISSLKIHNKIAQFLGGIMPELTEEESANITNYLPQQVWSKFNGLTEEVIREIDWNVANITSENQVKTYLEYLKNILNPMVSQLKTATWFDEVEKMDTNFAAKLANGLEKKQIRSFHLLHDLLWRSNRYYYVMYSKVETYIEGLLITKGGVTSIYNKKNPLTIYFEELNKTDKGIKHNQLSDDIITLGNRSGYKQRINENLGLTNRESLLILKYKYDARLIPFPLAKDQKLISNGRYKKYYTVFSPNRSVCKPATRSELQKIIPLLSDFLSAQKAAINDLDKLH